MKILKKTQLIVVLLIASSLAFGAVEQTNSEKSELQSAIFEEPLEAATIREGVRDTAIETHVGVAEEPNSEEPELKFTISEKQLGWDPELHQRLQIAGGPTHVAIFALENMRYWNPWFSERVQVRSPRSRWPWPLSRVTFKEEGERRRLTQLPGEFLLRRGRTDRPGKTFWLYATSEQEACEMAERFIRYAKSLAYAYVRRAENDLENYRKKITDIENEIPKLEEKKKPLEAELTKVKETTYFRNKDDAQRSILEWNNLLSAAEVDIIGIQAKLDMVKKLSNKEQKNVAPDELFSFLFRMRMTEEIELAGALARKNAALSYRDKALKFLDLAEKLDGLQDELDSSQRHLSDDQGRVDSIEERLPQLRADVRPVEVVNNEVTIHPVETQTP